MNVKVPLAPLTVVSLKVPVKINPFESKVSVPVEALEVVNRSTPMLVRGVWLAVLRIFSPTHWKEIFEIIAVAPEPVHRSSKTTVAAAISADNFLFSFTAISLFD